MGGPMCRNIIAGGHSVVVCDKNPQAVERCTALGAQAGATPKEVAGRVEVVMTSLPLPPNLEEVALGPDGIAAGAAKDLVHIDLSTNSPSFVRKIGAALEERGVPFLDAPVSGGVAGAEQGTIAIMVGGDAALFGRFRPVFDSFGKNVFHMGAVGAGSAAKLVNNMIAFCSMAAAAEGLMLGTAAGLDAEQLVEVVQASSGDSRGFRFLAEKALAGDWSPKFALDLGYKDIGLAGQMADELNVPLSVAPPTQNLMRVARSMGFGPDDITSMARVYEKLLGRTIKG